jgi:hypothetical protein
MTYDSSRIHRLYQKNTGTSGSCSLETKTDKRGQFAIFYSSTETVFFTVKWKLFGMKHFTVGAICSFAYIQTTIHRHAVTCPL